jgi:hypothetical protein
VALLAAYDASRSQVARLEAELREARADVERANTTLAGVDYERSIYLAWWQSLGRMFIDLRREWKAGQESLVATEHTVGQLTAIEDQLQRELAAVDAALGADINPFAETRDEAVKRIRDDCAALEKRAEAWKKERDDWMRVARERKAELAALRTHPPAQPAEPGAVCGDEESVTIEIDLRPGGTRDVEEALGEWVIPGGTQAEAVRRLRAEVERLRGLMRDFILAKEARYRSEEAQRRILREHTRNCQASWQTWDALRVEAGLPADDNNPFGNHGAPAGVPEPEGAVG